MTAFPTPRRIALALAALLLSVPAAHAASGGESPVYRCGGGAHPTYTSVPCADGVTVAAVARPATAQQAEARAVAQRDLALAAQMRAQRLDREAETGRTLAGGIGHTRPSTMASRDGDRAARGRPDRGDRCAAPPATRGFGSARRPSADCAHGARDPRVTHEIRLPRPAKTAKAAPSREAAKSIRGTAGGRAARA